MPNKRKKPIKIKKQNKAKILHTKKRTYKEEFVLKFQKMTLNQNH